MSKQQSLNNISVSYLSLDQLVLSQVTILEQHGHSNAGDNVVIR
jgi:hypothetical protein